MATSLVPYRKKLTNGFRS